MSIKEKIPCRVCGKLFEPCAYCKANSDVFRWRNFACSKECATKYIEEAIAYRESLKRNTKNAPIKNPNEKKDSQNSRMLAEKSVTAKKKLNKNSSENTTKAEIAIDSQTEEKITE